jgi:adenosylcobinamide kinase/adenosylcobinamide-phosphate guanylyltransferase
MFSTGKMSGAADRIMDGIKHVAEHAEELVIITNQVSSDGIDYPEGTAEYIAVLSEINRRTAVLADRVIECVYGIPVLLKGELPC